MEMICLCSTGLLSQNHASADKGMKGPSLQARRAITTDRICWDNKDLVYKYCRFMFETKNLAHNYSRHRITARQKFSIHHVDTVFVTWYRTETSNCGVFAAGLRGTGMSANATLYSEDVGS
jgi:hypothetical protein